MDGQAENMSLEELSGYMGVSKETVDQWAQKGIVPCSKSGVLWRFRRSEIEHWADSQIKVLKSKDVPDAVSLQKVLDADRVLITDSSKKLEVFNVLIDFLAKSPEVSSRQDLSDGIFYRESLMSTAIGMGIAVPHVRLATVKNIVLAAAICKNGIEEYETLDSIPVKLVFMIVARKDQHAEHLKLLSMLSCRLKNENFRKLLLSCCDPKSFHSLLSL
ncbi:MAG: hypothetical protein A2X49_03725 [Lentisphaerae bacterium GWF2_52_8]|nr:MAG: hypothetical protein A2X49_03725 [Lentisphaerae bacterium GWF2_52_8]